MTLVRALKAGTCRQPTTAWMVRVVRSRYIDRWRREQRNARIRRLAWASDRQHEDIVDVDRDLMPWLDRLPLTERMVLLMFFVDDLAVPDIASELGLSRSGTYALLGRAKESLRGLWEVTSDG